MPYIPQDQRFDFDDSLLTLPEFENKGQLEYCIFKLMKLYMAPRELTYSNLHDAVYAAQHCADEFRRRYLDRREDDAREKNGDVDTL